MNSSSFNATLPSPSFSFYTACLDSLGSLIIFEVYAFINVLFLLPLYFFVLYLGFQRRRKATSHSDFFTYHMMLLEIVAAFGVLVYGLASITRNITALNVGLFSTCIIIPGQAVFHLLTCIERYLAVVHPVTYMRLREKGGVRIRNVSILCSWLLCFGWIGITEYSTSFPSVPIMCVTGISALGACFCSLSVLRVLKSPGPGEKVRVDQSKRRAFHIILAILGTLLLRCAGLLFGSCLIYFPLSVQDICMLFDAGHLLSLPSSSVLPLLFLHKTGKLGCCRHSSESG
ncbi:hypothetical protein NQZ68_041618 [Dissostichus eleginoides]|nr:hypothetical protein NQZ68_041618 [Dissostichus eleginoides]